MCEEEECCGGCCNKEECCGGCCKKEECCGGCCKKEECCDNKEGEENEEEEEEEEDDVQEEIERLDFDMDVMDKFTEECQVSISSEDFICYLFSMKFISFCSR